MYEEPLKRKNNTLVFYSRFGENNNYFRHKPNPETEFGATNFVGARRALYENNSLSTGTVRRDHTLNP